MSSATLAWTGVLVTLNREGEGREGLAVWFKYHRLALCLLSFNRFS